MTNRPNIVLITTDQQRYDTVGPRSPEFLRTPHMDHMAREGITFSSAYAQCPMCVPSRVSVMTGHTVASHGMARNGHSSEVVDRET
ncbi:sulfatase-like hydrolase/transferase, partial [Phytoactinopolyspora endophytica]|uniref:sulfatase-like hydrolase/transferase n=1 Tax=Phytoactinopolyspora endophytica TaxID=1642495 RepID=UPI0013EDDBF8